MLFVQREIEWDKLALLEGETGGRAGGGEDDLADAILHGRFEDVDGANHIDVEQLRGRGASRPRHGCKMDHGVLTRGHAWTSWSGSMMSPAMNPAPSMRGAVRLKLVTAWPAWSNSLRTYPPIVPLPPVMRIFILLALGRTACQPGGEETLSYLMRCSNGQGHE